MHGHEPAKRFAVRRARRRNKILFGRLRGTAARLRGGGKSGAVDRVAVETAAMGEPFVWQGRSAGGPRWVVHPPEDRYGDGDVYTVETELSDDGMSAATVAVADGLRAFVRTLADDWRGWDGVRTWDSLEKELSLDARHDRRGYVSIGVTLRRTGGGWSARTVFVLEAGEQMSRFAADLGQLLETP
jgi:hypothetical protein